MKMEKAICEGGQSTSNKSAYMAIRKGGGKKQMEKEGEKRK